MKIIVTGSAGHLGEALVRTLSAQGYEVLGLDILDSPFTHAKGSIVDRSFVKSCVKDASAIIHTATLHKPHVATHSRQEFIDTNITGTLNLLEEAITAKTKVFLFTSTTSVFGRALSPAKGEPAAWITEEVRPVPKNIYGVTKSAAEDLCELFHQKFGLPCLILRTSRFFPEEDDNEETRAQYEDQNAKANELLFRRVELEDVVSAHTCALGRAQELGFGRYIISATTPFTQKDCAALRENAPGVVLRYTPGYAAEYARRGWRMFPSIDRVYVNERAQRELHWRPKHSFSSLIERLSKGEDLRSELTRMVGKKGYHPQQFSKGPYPTDP